MSKLSLIDLEAEMLTGRKQAKAGQRERLSGTAPSSGGCDSLASREMNRERKIRSGLPRIEYDASNNSGPYLELLQVYDRPKRVEDQADRELPSSRSVAERSGNHRREHSASYVHNRFAMDFASSCTFTFPRTKSNWVPRGITMKNRDEQSALIDLDAEKPTRGKQGEYSCAA